MFFNHLNLSTESGWKDGHSAEHDNNFWPSPQTPAALAEAVICATVSLHWGVWVGALSVNIFYATIKFGKAEQTNHLFGG